MTWVNRQGKVLESIGESGEMLALSPDATKAAFSRQVAPRNYAIWLTDLRTRQTSQLTFDPGREMNPLWSPDASRIAFVFYPNDGSGFTIREILANGKAHSTRGVSAGGRCSVELDKLAEEVIQR